MGEGGEAGIREYMTWDDEIGMCGNRPLRARFLSCSGRSVVTWGVILLFLRKTFLTGLFGLERH